MVIYYLLCNLNSWLCQKLCIHIQLCTKTIREWVNSLSHPVILTADKILRSHHTGSRMSVLCLGVG